MLPPEEYRRAAAEAAYHVQIAIEDVERGPGEARLRGSVVRVFRGPDALLATTMELTVACDDETDDWPPDGIGRVPSETLREGRVLEAFVETTPDGVEVALGLSTVLDSPTDSPQLRV